MRVAKANDIRYAPTECHHEGDCAGTCPKCEAEVRWLEQQLQLRRQLGKAVAVVGVSVGPFLPSFFIFGSNSKGC